MLFTHQNRRLQPTPNKQQSLPAPEWAAPVSLKSLFLKTIFFMILTITVILDFNHIPIVFNLGNQRLIRLAHCISTGSVSSSTSSDIAVTITKLVAMMLFVTSTSL